MCHSFNGRQSLDFEPSADSFIKHVTVWIICFCIYAVNSVMPPLAFCRPHCNVQLSGACWDCLGRNMAAPSRDSRWFQQYRWVMWLVRNLGSLIYLWDTRLKDLPHVGDFAKISRKKSQILLREKSHCSSSMLNKIRITLTKRTLIGSITSIARTNPKAIK